PASSPHIVASSANRRGKPGGLPAAFTAQFDGSHLPVRMKEAQNTQRSGAPMRICTAIPVYNEERHLAQVLREVRRYTPDIVVINDGSTDGTGHFLAQQLDLRVVTHPTNRGYGAALISAFAFAIQEKVDVLVTMDCDGQHEPARIPVLL